MKRNVFALLYYLTLTYGLSFGQRAVQVAISDSTTGKAIACINVLLLKALDSTLVSGNFGDGVGNYIFHNVSGGKYLILSSHTGFGQRFSNSFDITANAEKPVTIMLRLQTKHALLKEVIVMAQKPLLEQKIDRLIVDVASSIISAGNTALDWNFTDLFT